MSLVQEAHSIYHVKETKQTSKVMMWRFPMTSADPPGRDLWLELDSVDGQLLKISLCVQYRLLRKIFTDQQEGCFANCCFHQIWMPPNIGKSLHQLSNVKVHESSSNDGCKEVLPSTLTVTFLFPAEML